jgi:hypothetical protein
LVPIKPENRDRYPANWTAVAVGIKLRAGWRCECTGECGRGTHEGRCPNVHGRPAYATGSLVVLTVAHLNHTPEDCSASNLKAFCAGCHLHYDRGHHAETRAITQRLAREEAGQMVMVGQALPVKFDLCECGHPLAEHAESGWGPNTVCVEQLDDENAGWYGVCPCIRHDSLDPPIDPLADSGDA